MVLALKPVRVSLTDGRNAKHQKRYATCLPSREIIGIMRWLPSFCLLMFAGAVAAAQIQASHKRTASLNQVVEPATPQIQWTPSSTIALGDSLSALELNAAAGIPGTYSYVPGAGTVLPLGQQALNVVFTPTDTNYAEVTQMATIHVVENNGATFTLDSATTPPTVVQAGQFTNATQQVSIKPVGILNQAVHLSCIATPGVVCTFTPDEVRPGGNTIPIQLVVHLPSFLFHNASQGALLPLLCLLPLSLIRKDLFPRIMGVALVFSMGVAIIGCGQSRPFYVTIVASTSTETRSLNLDLTEVVVQTTRSPVNSAFPVQR